MLEIKCPTCARQLQLPEDALAGIDPLEAFLGSLEGKSKANRMDLAQWLTAKDHPLVARVLGSSGYSASTNSPRPAPSSAAPIQSSEAAVDASSLLCRRLPATRPVAHSRASGRFIRCVRHLMCRTSLC